MSARSSSDELVVESICSVPPGKYKGASLLLKEGIEFVLRIPALASIRKIMASHVFISAIGFYLKTGFHPSVTQRSKFYDDLDDKQTQTNTFLEAQLRWSKRLPQPRYKKLIVQSSLTDWEGDIWIVRDICASKMHRAGWLRTQGPA